MIGSVCLYAASSNNVSEEFLTAAERLGEGIAKRGYSMIFGGGAVGLMGRAARGAKRYSGKIIGVIPEALNRKGIVYEKCDELIVTTCLRERKAAMDSRADAFFALPGGYGTLEELMEQITLKQLGYHCKPIVILNINGYYDELLGVFEKLRKERFAKPETADLYFVTTGIEEAFDFIENYSPPRISNKYIS